MNHERFEIRLSPTLKNPGFTAVAVPNADPLGGGVQLDGAAVAARLGTETSALRIRENRNSRSLII
jgi:hypothetical protein